MLTFTHLVTQSPGEGKGKPADSPEGGGITERERDVQGAHPHPPRTCFPPCFSVHLSKVCSIFCFWERLLQSFLAQRAWLLASFHSFFTSPSCLLGPPTSGVSGLPFVPCMAWPHVWPHHFLPGAVAAASSLASPGSAWPPRIFCLQGSHSQTHLPSLYHQYHFTFLPAACESSGCSALTLTHGVVGPFTFSLSGECVDAIFS